MCLRIGVEYMNQRPENNASMRSLLVHVDEDMDRRRGTVTKVCVFAFVAEIARLLTL